MAAMSTLQDRVFDFFQLPRELRDFIYEGLTCDIIIQGEEQDIQRAVIRNAPIEKLLTLNKHLMMNGITMNCSRIPLGRRAGELKRVEIRLLLFADKMNGALNELTDHEEWVIATIQSLAKVEFIECSYYLCIGASGEWLERWQEDPFWAPLETFIKDADVSTLKIRQVQQMEEARGDNRA
ncbi:hypothetical protein LTR17_010523 [Elasticomyces elasticus]|nr:hypothetical protein LTR17_010523 [Elasticomyces elasticus]